MAIEVKDYFKKDFKRIAHATKVARYAGELVKEEKGDPAVVLIAAYLHDLAPSRPPGDGPAAPEGWKEKPEGISVRDILAKVGATPELIAEVLGILSHLEHPGEGETLNEQVVKDADRLARLEERQGEIPGVAVEEEPAVPSVFLTATGRRLARKVLHLAG